MKNKNNITIPTKKIIFGIIICFLVITIITIITPKYDKELNNVYNNIYTECKTATYYYYSDLFKNSLPKKYLLHLNSGLQGLIDAYDEVYSKKSKYFYHGMFEGLYQAEPLNGLYNSDPEFYYFLKPFLDCYNLMDKNNEVSEKELLKIKETILAAKEFYIYSEIPTE